MNTKEIDDLIGQKVKVVSLKKELSIGDEIFITENFQLQEDDPVVHKVKSHFMQSRWHLPGQRFTADFKFNRLNVKLDRVDDETFVITKFYFG